MPTDLYQLKQDNKSGAGGQTEEELAAAREEKAMLAQARDGDRQAFGLLVQAYQRRAYYVAYGFVGNREDALEMSQDSFAKAFKAMARFDTRYPFYPWLYRIVKNTCLNHLKKRKRRRETSLEYLAEEGCQMASGDATPERNAELSDLRESLEQAMNNLSDDHREIIALRHFQELSYAEIAELLEVPKGTVMSRLHAARRSLRKEMEAP